MLSLLGDDKYKEFIEDIFKDHNIFSNYQSKMIKLKII